MALPLANTTLTLAAEKNNARGMFNLTRMHKDGRGVSQSHAVAFKLSKLADVQSFALAKHDLDCI